MRTGKALSLAMSVCMVVGLCPAYALAAQVDEPAVPIVEPADEQDGELEEDVIDAEAKLPTNDGEQDGGKVTEGEGLGMPQGDGLDTTEDEDPEVLEENEPDVPGGEISDALEGEGQGDGAGQAEGGEQEPSDAADAIATPTDGQVETTEESLELVEDPIEADEATAPIEGVAPNGGTGDTADDAKKDKGAKEDRGLTAQQNGNGGETLVLGDPIGGTLSSYTDKNLYTFELTKWGYVTIGWSNQYHATGIWNMRLEDATYGSESNYIAQFSWGHGHNNAEDSQVSQRIGLPPGVYSIWVSTTKAGYAKNVNYAFEVDFVASNTWEREPVNDVLSGATSMKVGTSYSGTMLSPTDTDVYAFKLSKAQAIRLNWSNKETVAGMWDGNPSGSTDGASWTTTLYGSSGKVKTWTWHDNKTAARNSSVVWLAAGEYFVHVNTKGETASNFSTAQYNLAVRASRSVAWAKVSSIAKQGYTGAAITPTPTVKLGTKKLKLGTDYTLSYANNRKRGTATITIKGAGSFTGTKKVKFKIVRGNIKDATVSAIKKQGYTGGFITPKPTVRMAGTLTEGSSYTLSYANNRKRGTATITIQGMGNYTGSKKVTFKIVRGNIRKATVSKIANQPYSGGAIMPKPTVRMAGVLNEGKSYTLSYADNVKRGTATITITGKGNYTGKRTVTFKIV